MTDRVHQSTAPEHVDTGTGARHGTPPAQARWATHFVRRPAQRPHTYSSSLFGSNREGDRGGADGGDRDVTGGGDCGGDRGGAGAGGGDCDGGGGCERWKAVTMV